MRTCATCSSFTRRTPDGNYGSCAKQSIYKTKVGGAVRVTVNQDGFCDLHRVSIMKKLEGIWKHFSHKLLHKSTSPD